MHGSITVLCIDSSVAAGRFGLCSFVIIHSQTIRERVQAALKDSVEEASNIIMTQTPGRIRKVL